MSKTELLELKKDISGRLEFEIIIGNFALQTEERNYLLDLLIKRGEVNG